MKRIARDRKLTPEEAEKYSNIRKQVDREKSVISARIRGRLANRELAKKIGRASCRERVSVLV